MRENFGLRAVERPQVAGPAVVHHAGRDRVDDGIDFGRRRSDEVERPVRRAGEMRVRGRVPKPIDKPHPSERLGIVDL